MEHRTDDEFGEPAASLNATLESLGAVLDRVADTVSGQACTAATGAEQAQRATAELAMLSSGLEEMLEQFRTTTA